MALGLDGIGLCAIGDMIASTAFRRMQQLLVWANNQHDYRAAMPPLQRPPTIM